MTAFLIGAALLAAIALGLLLWPLLRRNAAATAATSSRQQLNAAIYRGQMAELDSDRADGDLDEADWQQARQELQRRLLDDGADAPTSSPVAAGEPAATGTAKGLATALATVIPAVAAALYFILGNPAALNPKSHERNFSAPEIEQMVAGLAARLEKEPDNLKGWVMLGRSYKAMGRFDEAEKAYGRAMKLVETDADLLADYADLLAARAGGKLEGKPNQLIAQALKLDPDNMQALWLAGTAAFDRKDFGKAVEHWERLKKRLPPDSEDAQSIARSIEEARAGAARSPKP